MTIRSTTKKNWLLLLTLVGFTSLLATRYFAKDRIPEPKILERHQANQASFASVARRVDAVFEARWQKAGISPTRPADTHTVVRRLSLGLMGTVPSLEELRRLEKLPPELQLPWWIARLLEDRRTSDYLAERFARGFVGVGSGPFVVYRRHRFTEWLSDQFQQNRPYDQIVREMLTAEGLWTDTPQTNYVSAHALLDGQNETNAVALAGKTSRALLAMRLDCLECHDDFLGNIKLGSVSDPKGGEQIDFHRLAAFFGQTKITLAGVQDRPDAAPYRYKLLEDDDARVVEPDVPYDRHRLPTVGAPRTRLAQWVTHRDNRPFARAALNRLWATMFGRPLIEPIDDIPLLGPHPEELEILVNDFIAHDYDLQRAIRIIAATRVFQLSSAAEDSITDEHERLLAVFPLTRLRPEQVARSLIQATSLETIDARANILRRLELFGSENDFIERYGDFGEDEFVTRGETVTQRLLMMNGDLVRRRIDENLFAPNRIAMVSPSAEKTAEALYLVCFTRYPTVEEQQHVAERLNRSKNERRTTIQDYFWALLNSAEFGWSH